VYSMAFFIQPIIQVYSSWQTCQNIIIQSGIISKSEEFSCNNQSSHWQDTECLASAGGEVYLLRFAGRSLERTEANWLLQFQWSKDLINKLSI
jgi:hypothetical protein